jgi:serine/threonine-protein kinase
MLVGQVLASTYRVEGLLGRGGMGAVYAAAHLRLPLRVAIKVLHAEVAANPTIFARFRREAEIASSLRHPNIVQVFDFNQLPDGTPYIVMEYLDGHDLHARLLSRGRLTFPEAVTLCREVGGGLAAAHRRDVVHRDLKPQNIFLARHEQGDEIIEIAKIVDFGISKIRHAVTDSLKTQDQTLLGTPHYMSPEQARGTIDLIDHRTDQWALAAILYQCLSGRLAFPGANLPGIIYQVVMGEPQPLREDEAPPHAQQAIRRALSKARDDRFPSIKEFVRAFCGELVHDHPAVATPQPSPGSQAPVPGPGSLGTVGEAGGQVVPHPGRRRLLFGLAGLGVGAGLLGLLWLGQPARQSSSVPPLPQGEGPGVRESPAQRPEQAALPDLAAPDLRQEPPDLLQQTAVKPEEKGDRPERRRPGRRGPVRRTPESDADDVDLSGIR